MNNFCQRARNCGYKIVYAPQLIVVHQESTSVKKFYGMKEYYLARNHLIFLFKHAPTSIKFRELIRLPKTLLEFKKDNKKSKYKIKGTTDFLVGKRRRSEYWD
jgi:GT2 family glycosyltransferase